MAHPSGTAAPFIRVMVLAAALLLTASLVSADCFTRRMVINTDTYYRGGLRAAPPISGCAAEAEAARRQAIQDTVNIEAISTSAMRSDMESIAASKGATGVSGSYSSGSTSGGSTSIQYAGVRWITVVEGCNTVPGTVDRRDGKDRGWGQGRAANGYCTAKVQCKLRFYTPQINC